MKIVFKSKKLQKSLTNAIEMHKTFGTMAKKINQRMKELSSSQNLEVLKTIPAANCHDLKGKRKGEFAVNISNNYRLIFEPDHDPLPLNDDNSINCLRVTDIRILGTVDYH